jgi:ABC-type uncharacterized transport system involved in gliding motility auxiliary subunit
MWIGVLAENANHEHSVTTNFSGVDLYWPSPIELHTLGHIESDILFTSTNQAWSMRGPFYTSPEITYMFEKDANETKGIKIFGVSLSGEFPSFFRGAPKPVREGSDEELPDMPVRASPSRIIVVSDVDFATNMMNATQANYNLDFLLRAADWLASDDDVTGIRNRQPHIGRFDKIIDEDKRASAMRFSQVINLAVVPVLVILTGLALAWRRTKRSRSAELKNTKENPNVI